MHDAAKKGGLKKLKRLVEAGHDVNQRDGWMATIPLMYAAMRGHTDCVEYLLQNGAQLDLKDRDGKTALHLAADGGHLEVIKKLVEKGQDVNRKDWGETTPLMEASGKGHTDCVNWLLENGAQVDMEDILGRKAFDLASQKSTLRLLRTPSDKGE